MMMITVLERDKERKSGTSERAERERESVCVHEPFSQAGARSMTEYSNKASSC